MNAMPLPSSQTAPRKPAFDSATDHVGEFARKMLIRLTNPEETFEEVCFASQRWRGGLLFISRRSGYKVGRFVDVVLSNPLAEEIDEPSQRAEIIHVLQTSRGDLAIGLRYEGDA